jgi:ATP:ADP antiporter, AAA family
VQPAPPAAPEAGALPIIGATRTELPAVLWSFLYFFSLLAGYYVLRPVRDALGTPYPLQWLFLATFICMLALVPVYGTLVARYPRRVFLPIVYLFFIACLFAFYVMMQMELGGKWRDAAFFVWVAVFNLFAVSVFWSFMSDVFDNGQAHRLFGAIAAGGTSGTLLGSALTVSLAERIGTPNMLLVSGSLLCVCLLCLHRLVPWARDQERVRGWRSGEDAIGGSIFAGAQLIFRSKFLIACCGLMFFGVAVGTLIYNHQQAFARIEFPDRDQRTAFFATIDLAMNTLVLTTQLFLTRFLMTRYGVTPMLLVPTAFVFVGMIAIGVAPMFGFSTQRYDVHLLATTFSLSGAQLLLSVVQIVTRAGNFSLIQPARESLFTLVDQETRYKSKNFIDTVVYRGADISFAWVYIGITQWLMLGATGVAAMGALMVFAMGVSAAAMVRLQRQMPRARDGEAQAKTAVSA